LYYDLKEFFFGTLQKYVCNTTVAVIRKTDNSGETYYERVNLNTDGSKPIYIPERIAFCQFKCQNDGTISYNKNGEPNYDDCYSLIMAIEFFFEEIFLWFVQSIMPFLDWVFETFLSICAYHQLHELTIFEKLGVILQSPLRIPLNALIGLVSNNILSLPDLISCYGFSYTSECLLDSICNAGDGDAISRRNNPTENDDGEEDENLRPNIGGVAGSFLEAASGVACLVLSSDGCPCYRCYHPLFDIRVPCILNSKTTECMRTST